VKKIKRCREIPMTEMIIGNRYWQIDLHIHTPGSDDYKETDISPIDIVNASLDTGLEAIAITDHNDIAWVESVRKAGEDLGLIVFPGFEINASGGHVLAIFNPYEDMEVIETALIESGIKKKEFGNQRALGRDIKRIYDCYRSGASKNGYLQPQESICN
jgi:DNA polymerase III alpha subunit (gram-positive type)